MGVNNASDWEILLVGEHNLKPKDIFIIIMPFIK